jgi:hypothetical protein
MIDPTWLETLSFPIQGGKVTGLAGMGSENVVLDITTDTGSRMVVRCPKRMIAFHISEAPPELSHGRLYSVANVNRKLRELVGRRNFDTCSLHIDNLCSYVLKFLSEHGVGKFIFSNMQPDSIESIPFALHLPPIRRKLEDWASRVVDDKQDLSSFMPAVNGETFAIRLLVSSEKGCISAWVKEALEGLDRLPEYNVELRADAIFDNPLVIWGAAAMEGFFSDKEMPEAARFIEEAFGELHGRDDVHTLMGQAAVLANLFAYYLPDAPVDRFVRLCAACRVGFEARDRNGQVVADGIRMMMER